MHRRLFTVGMSTLALASLHARAEDRIRRIGYLGNLSPTSNESRAVVNAFVAELRRLQWVQGRNIAFEFQYADGKNDRFASLARDLVASKVDVLAAMTTLAARAAKESTSTIPIVFVAAEPVEYGLVTSLGRPGGNLTGLALVLDWLMGKRMQLLTQAIPTVVRIAYLGLNETQSVEIAKASAELLKKDLLLVQVSQPEDLPRAIASGSQADAWLVDEYPMFNANRARIIDLIATQKKPAVFGSNAWVREGGLLSYAPDPEDVWRRAAGYVDRILRGSKPADMPVEEPTRFTLSINLKAARALGLPIERSVLLGATEIIE